MNLKPKCDNSASTRAILGVVAAALVTAGVYATFGLPGLYAAGGLALTIWR